MSHSLTMVLQPTRHSGPAKTLRPLSQTTLSQAKLDANHPLSLSATVQSMNLPFPQRVHNTLAQWWGLAVHNTVDATQRYGRYLPLFQFDWLDVSMVPVQRWIGNRLLTFRMRLHGHWQVYQGVPLHKLKITPADLRLSRQAALQVLQRYVNAWLVYAIHCGDNELSLSLQNGITLKHHDLKLRYRPHRYTGQLHLQEVHFQLHDWHADGHVQLEMIVTDDTPRSPNALPKGAAKPSELPHFTAILPTSSRTPQLLLTSCVTAFGLILLVVLV